MQILMPPRVRMHACMCCCCFSFISSGKIRSISRRIFLPLDTCPPHSPLAAAHNCFLCTVPPLMTVSLPHCVARSLLEPELNEERERESRGDRIPEKREERFCLLILIFGVEIAVMTGETAPAYFPSCSALLLPLLPLLSRSCLCRRRRRRRCLCRALPDPDSRTRYHLSSSSDPTCCAMMKCRECALCSLLPRDSVPLSFDMHITYAAARPLTPRGYASFLLPLLLLPTFLCTADLSTAFCSPLASCFFALPGYAEFAVEAHPHKHSSSASKARSQSRDCSCFPDVAGTTSLLRRRGEGKEGSACRGDRHVTRGQSEWVWWAAVVDRQEQGRCGEGHVRTGLRRQATRRTIPRKTCTLGPFTVKI